jgi:hypothetical protein
LELSVQVTSGFGPGYDRLENSLSLRQYGNSHAEMEKIFRPGRVIIDIEVGGSKASFQWNLQTSDQMWQENRDSNNEQVMRNPNLAASLWRYAVAEGCPALCQNMNNDLF